jgi:hypothetical protein
MTEPRKRSPAEVWRALENASTDAEVGRIDALSDDELDAELRAAGIDPADAAKIGADVLGPAPASGDGGVASRVPARTGVAEAKPAVDDAPRGRRRAYWIAGFAAAAVVIGVLVTRPSGGPEVGTGHPDTEAALKEAADLRDRAFGACDEGYWAACEDALNAARSLDPAGETAPRVVAARRSIEAVGADAGRRFEKPPKP